jgi:hypothetical protein
MKTMQRRDFLKIASALSVGRVLPVGLGVGALAQQAHADSPNYAGLEITPPTVMPQVINIFMYGGASELAGNLSNIQDIDTNSENSYAEAFGNRILRTEAEALADAGINDDDWELTPNNFWRSAGGTHMEDMLAAGDMAIYRTIYKQKSPTRSHRESIFMSHKGTLDIENSPGIGSRLALMMQMNEDTFSAVNTADDLPLGALEDLVLPFVSFEGDSQTYALDPNNPMPVFLRGLTMDNQFNNPYSRTDNTLGASETAITDLLSLREATIEASASKYTKAFDGFKDREDLNQNMEGLQDELGLNDGTTSSAFDLGVTYPGGSFSDQIEAAVTLALHNPQTLYMAVGTPGLGGWDDHNNGIDRYPGRMNDLMESIKAGMEHIKAAEVGITTVAGNPRTQTNNIIINVFGDFGRLVNLNNSGGWDHANNQNLYTFGGAGVRPTKEAAAMGTVVGSTIRTGTPKTNNQYTVPADGSVTFEPMSIAASIYGCFGVTNPNVMTASEGNENGDVRLEDIL